MKRLRFRLTFDVSYGDLSEAAEEVEEEPEPEPAQLSEAVAVTVLSPPDVEDFEDWEEEATARRPAPPRPTYRSQAFGFRSSKVRA
jgi:hypothetical protein